MDHVDPVVVARIAKHVVDAAVGAFLGIASGIDTRRDARLHHRAGAHRTRLQRRVHGDTVKTPATDDPGNPAQQLQLRMSGGITAPLDRVARGRQDGAVAHRNRTDRHLASRAGGASRLQGTTHEALVGIDRYPTATSGSSIVRSGRSTTRMVSSTKRTRSKVMQFTGQ